ncbi:MAG: hypothetical protein JSR80_06920 [Verrucomicrobia bacterium]|nr:hypothetical protein [Verrucomicrobiota bacterium]
MIGDTTLFVLISIERTGLFKQIWGEYVPSTRGYLLFQEHDKLVILSQIEPTMPGERHTPGKHKEKLKSELLKFRETFDFNPSIARDEGRECA